MQSEEACCVICQMQFHNLCMDKDNELCFACKETLDNSQIIKFTQDQSTCAKTMLDDSITPSEQSRDIKKH